MSRERGGFGGDSLHQVAVRDDGINVSVKQFRRIRRGEMRRGDGHAHACRKSLPKRTGGHLHAGGESVFGMAGRAAFPLAKILQFVEREIVAC